MIKVKAFSACRLILEPDYPPGNQNRTVIPEIFLTMHVIYQKSSKKFCTGTILCINSFIQKLYVRILPDKETFCARICPAKETYMQEYFQTMKVKYISGKYDILSDFLPEIKRFPSNIWCQQPTASVYVWSSQKLSRLQKLSM